MEGKIFCLPCTKPCGLGQPPYLRGSAAPPSGLPWLRGEPEASQQHSRRTHGHADPNQYHQMIVRRASCRWAPSAMRTPISFVRHLTKRGITRFELNDTHHTFPPSVNACAKPCTHRCVVYAVDLNGTPPSWPSSQTQRGEPNELLTPAAQRSSGRPETALRRASFPFPSASRNAPLPTWRRYRSSGQNTRHPHGSG